MKKIFLNVQERSQSSNVQIVQKIKFWETVVVNKTDFKRITLFIIKKSKHKRV